MRDEHRKIGVGRRSLIFDVDESSAIIPSLFSSAISSFPHGVLSCALENETSLPNINRWKYLEVVQITTAAMLMCFIKSRVSHSRQPLSLLSASLPSYPGTRREARWRIPAMLAKSDNRIGLYKQELICFERRSNFQQDECQPSCDRSVRRDRSCRMPGQCHRHWRVLRRSFAIVRSEERLPRAARSSALSARIRRSVRSDPLPDENHLSFDERLSTILDI